MWQWPSVRSDQCHCARENAELNRYPSFCLFTSMHLARTDILWPTLLRSRGCSMLRWRKTSSLAALSVNKGENRLSFCGAGWSWSTERPLFFQVQGCDWCLLAAAWHRSSALWRPDRDWRAGTLFCSLLMCQTVPLILLYHFLCVVVIQGINLSGGQRQRICVARALYQNTNIVFLVSVNTSDIEADRIKHPLWWWQSKYFPYYSITSLLDELQRPFLYSWC